MKAIFLLGSERSGSNLLRTLLGNHAQVSAPIAPHLCLIFFNHFKNYFPLDLSSKRDLLDDLNQFVNIPFHDWNIDLPNEQESLERLNSFPEFMNFVYSEKAKSEKKGCYFCKDNDNHKFALGILKDVPDAKFIYLYRDPRDQVASWMKTPLFLHTPYDALKKWKKEQEQIRVLKEYYNVNMFPVKYEDLIDNPETVMSNVLSFLQLPIDSNCFDTRQDNQEAGKHPLWKNINKPIQKQNFGKFKSILKEEDVQMIETQASTLMKSLGYDLITDGNWQKGNDYIFRLKQKIKRYNSERKSVKFRKNEMSILAEKRQFRKELFAKRNPKKQNK